MIRTIRFALTVLLFGSAAIAGQTAFDPRKLKTAIAGPPTQVLVLGSTHLSGLKAFQPDMITPLLDRLAAFRPDIITIESLSGQQCDLLRRYPTRYQGTWEGYCWDNSPATKATGLAVPEAEAAADKELASWPASPSPAQRRHLAALFLAANDRASALVQWLRLPAIERHAGDGLDDALVAVLERKPPSYNENYEIGSALAARLGLERVYPVDDHTADDITGSAGPDFEAAIMRVWRPATPPAIRTAYEAREKAVKDGATLLDFYRFLNTPATQRATVAADFGAAARQDTARLYGRWYLAWWETRNLRMVANIRATFGQRPGARVLVIVGASHKPYFDAYLDMMQDVRLVGIDGVLR